MKKTKKKEIKKSDIPVVIFCGGRGTRLREETEFIPKPMVRIGEKPILWHIMKIYHAQGFRRFILLLGYKGDNIREYVHSHSTYAGDFTLKHSGSDARVIRHGRASEDWEITCIDTGLETQTGGRLRKAAAYVKAPVFMLTYGDGVSDVDLSKLLDKHQESGKMATLTAVHPPVRFGEVVLKPDGAVEFSEKPLPGASTNFINGGFFAVDSRIFKSLPDDDALVFEKDVLPELAKNNELAVLQHRGYWQCMDTIRDTEVLNETWKSGAAPWKIWE